MKEILKRATRKQLEDPETRKEFLRIISEEFTFKEVMECFKCKDKYDVKEALGHFDIEDVINYAGENVSW